MRESVRELNINKNKEHLGQKSMWVKVQGPWHSGVYAVESIPWLFVCPAVLGPPVSCPVARVPWDSHLLTLNCRGYVYFHLKVNIQRLVAQYIFLNNWEEESKGFF